MQEKKHRRNVTINSPVTQQFVSAANWQRGIENRAERGEKMNRRATTCGGTTCGGMNGCEMTSNGTTSGRTTSKQQRRPVRRLEAGRLNMWCPLAGRLLQRPTARRCSAGRLVALRSTSRPAAGCAAVSSKTTGNGQTRSLVTERLAWRGDPAQ